MIAGKHRKRQRRRLLASALIVAGVGLVAGCAQADLAELELPAPNRAQWVMPTDRYVMSEEANEAVSYATLLIDGECVTDAGYEANVPFKDVAASWQSATWNSVGLRLFNESIAAEFGYHLAARALPNREQWQMFNWAPMSEDASAAWQTCRANRAVDIPGVDEAQNQLSALIAAADDAAHRSAAVVDAIGDWRECMAQLGLADLPDSPWGTPTQSQNGAFDMVEGSLTAQPSAEEIAQASFDAACEESSGYAEAYYEAGWEENLQVLQNNKDTFERARIQFAEAYEMALTIIAERAPSS